MVLKTETKLIAYSKEKSSLTEPVSLTKLSEALLFTSLNVIAKSKNLIVVYPENIFRPATFLGYNFMKEKKQDVLFFTSDRGTVQENPFRFHLENFCMLQELGASWFLWHNYLPCILEEDQLDIEIIFRKGVRTKTKQSELVDLKEKLKNDEMGFNRIIFCTKLINARKLSNIKNLNFEKNLYKFQERLGLCIFENLSTKINSSEEIDIFVEWLKPLFDRNINFIFHISNFIDMKFIEEFKDKTNSIILYLSPELLNKGRKFFYDQSPILSKENDNLSLKYNLDSNIVYQKENCNISILKIPGFKYTIKEANNLVLRASKSKKIPKQLISRIKKTIFLLPKLTVNPTTWGRALTYKFEDGDYKHISVLELINEIDKYKKSFNKEDYDLLNNLKHELTSLHNRFAETDRFLEGHPFKKQSKPYKIIELVKNLKEKSDSPILIAVYDASERRILNNTIKSIISDSESIQIKTLNQIAHLTNLPAKTKLILPSYLVTKYISEFFKTYEEILILNYKGEEAEQTQKELEIINQTNDLYINQSIDYFNKLYDSLNWKKDNFIEELNNFKVKEPEEQKKEISESRENVIEIIKNRILKEDDLKKNDELFNDSQDEILFDEEYTSMRKDFSLTVSSIEDSSFKKIELPKGATLLTINSSEEIEEKDIQELNEGDLIILIQGDERKSFIDYLVKRSGLEDEIDIFHIKVWKDKLNSFMEKNSLNEKTLFKMYLEYGGDVTTNPFIRWKDSVKNIAPRRKEDLEIIAKIIEYKYILENIDEIFEDIKKLRKFHRSVGREMNKIIKDKLSGEFKESSFDDFDLSNKLNIFKIEKITKNDQKV